MIIICLSQLKVETSNSISSSNAMSNLFNSLFGITLKWPVAVVLTNAIGLIFIFGNILDKVNSFMSMGSILTMSWGFLLITDYYIVRGRMHIGSKGIVSLKYIPAVNWRGIVTIAISAVVGCFVYFNGIVSVPVLVVAPLTMGMYILLSLLFKKQALAKDTAMRDAELADPELAAAALARQERWGK